MIKVLVNGAAGKMGSETVNAVKRDSSLQLVAQTDQNDNLADAIRQTRPDVAVDFTHPDSVKQNVLTMLQLGVSPVVGTTGLTTADLEQLRALASAGKIGTLICPNFAIGAVLMMKFAAQAVKHMTKAEIIEFHHDKKADAPSGTAIKTAEMMAAANPMVNNEELKEKESIKGARGGKLHRIPIHSVRLEGYVAHQEVILGGLGQTLTIRHDTISRESFMPGVILAIKKVRQLNELVYGLENVL